MKLYFSLLISIFIGGVISGNILGDMKQKTAEVVFFVWKGIQVFRKRVTPANPRTDAQIAQRDFFTAVLRVGQDVNNSIIKPFWKHFAIKKSEFNAWMSYNLLSMSSATDFGSLSYARGSLYPTPITVATYNTENGVVTVEWDGVLIGDQSDDDIPVLVVLDIKNIALYVNAALDSDRTAGEISTTIPTGYNASDIRAFLFFTDVLPSDPNFKVSNSATAVCTAP